MLLNLKEKDLFILGYKDGDDVVPASEDDGSFKIFTKEADAMHIREKRRGHAYDVYRISCMELTKLEPWAGGTRENTACSKDY